jgi:hypothetical protein
MGECWSREVKNSSGVLSSAELYDPVTGIWKGDQLGFLAAIHFIVALTGDGVRLSLERLPIRISELKAPET